MAPRNPSQYWVAKIELLELNQNIDNWDTYRGESDTRRFQLDPEH